MFILYFHLVSYVKTNLVIMDSGNEIINKRVVRISVGHRQSQIFFYRDFLIFTDNGQIRNFSLNHQSVDKNVSIQFRCIKRNFHQNHIGGTDLLGDIYKLHTFARFCQYFHPLPLLQTRYLVAPSPRFTQAYSDQNVI